jgi:hypothetical protein
MCDGQTALNCNTEIYQGTRVMSIQGIAINGDDEQPDHVRVHQAASEE